MSGDSGKLDRLKQAVPLPARQLVRRLVGARKPVQRPHSTRPVGSVGGTLDCCIAYNEFGGYCVPRESIARPSAQRIMRGGVWEPETLALMRKHCGSGDIVHAGTYFGDFLPYLSRSLAADARVWAFEPNPVHARCAAATVAVNGLRNVELTNAGLGARSSTAQLQVEDAAGVKLGGGSRVVDLNTTADGQDGAGLESIRLVAIDDVVPTDRTVSVVQLDVEGFEHEALEGARATIERSRPLVIVEKRLREDWFAEHLEPLGYQVVGRVHFNSVLQVPPR